MARKGMEPHQVGLVLLIGSIALLEMYYEFVGMQSVGMPKGGPRPLNRHTVIERLREEKAGLGLPTLNVSGLVLHGKLEERLARQMELRASEIEEINQILPEEDFQHHYGTCALVGNSASLLQYQFGNEIDGHDIVLRFNDAPTRTFEEHVGRRCTFRAASQEHTRLLLGITRSGGADKSGHKDKQAVKPGARTILMLPDNPGRYYAEMRHKFQENIVMYVSSEVENQSNKIYNAVADRLKDLGEQEAKHRESHSTGLSAVFFLLQVCRKVSLYGFQPVAPPQGSSMPSAIYYDKVMTDSDITASAMSFLFWRVLNTENIVRLRC